MAEKVLDEAAKCWKKNGGGVLVPGEGEELKSILRNIEGYMSGGKPLIPSGQTGSSSFSFEASNDEVNTIEPNSRDIRGSDNQPNLDQLVLGVEHEEDAGEARDPRRWLRVVGAFNQPRLTYNVNQKHFEIANTTPSLLPNPSHKTQFFRHRYNLIHQRLLRNESFQASSVATARVSTLGRSSSSVGTVQQAYKLTPIANLLGRSGSSHLLLGLLTNSPTGTLTLSDLTGSIGLDIQYARPVPENGAWFAPGMIVLMDGVYEEEASSAGPGLEGNRGVGGTIRGKFVAFSMGGPPCERRDATLGIVGTGKDGASGAGAGFGWVDFLGVGSERAAGSAMRRLESVVFKKGVNDNSTEGRSKMIFLGEVQLDNARTLQALRKLLGLYAADQPDQAPIVVVLMGNFVHHAVMTGGGIGGSIEYKEYFDSLASALSDYPTMLQRTTFVFVPGDNDPWASAFSAGAATALPRSSVPGLFTSRVKRAFASANAEAERATGTKSDGEAIWSTNPTRLTLFGPNQEILLFRDDVSGRFRRNAVRFRPCESEHARGPETATDPSKRGDVVTEDHHLDHNEDMAIDTAVETAESHIPAPQSKEVVSATTSSDLETARKLVKTILDQGHLSPFPLSDRPTLWDFVGALQLYPLPTALVLMDADAPPFAVTYEGCHVMNPGPLTTPGRRGVAQWIEYDARSRRGKTREVRF